MKRWLAVILAALLCCALPARAESPAEPEAPFAGEGFFIPDDIEPEPEPTFLDSLAEWAGKLDPSAYDLQGDLTLGAGAWSATLRRDDDLWDLTVPGLGTLQIDQRSMALQTPDQTYRLDFEPIIAAFAEAQAFSEGVPEDAALIGQLLRQAAEEVLLPFVELRPGYNGLSAHIDVNAEALEQRLYAFIGKALEGDAASRLFARYGQYLRAELPDFPESMESLRSAWAEVSADAPRLLPDFTLDADAVVRYNPWSGTEIACAGRASDDYSQIGFNLEFSGSGGGFSLVGGLTLSNRYYRRDLSATLALRGNSLDGELRVETLGWPSTTYALHAALPGNTVDLDLRCARDTAELWAATLYGRHDPATYGLRDDSLSATLRINGWQPRSYALDIQAPAGRIDADLRCREDGDDVWAVSLAGQHDAGNGTISGSVDYTEYAYGEEARTTRVASIDARYWWNGCEGTLRAAGHDARFRATAGSGYSHLSIRTQPTGNNYYYAAASALELWLFRQGDDGYRLRCELAQSRGGRLFRRLDLSGQMDESGLSFSLSDPLSGTSTTGSVRCTEQANGFDFNMEFLRDAERFYRSTGVEKLPFSLRLSKSGSEYTASCTYMDEYSALRVSAKLTLDGDGLSALEGDLSAGTPENYNLAENAYHLSYAPGRLVVSGEFGAVTLERQELSARRIAYLLSTSAGANVALALSVELDEDLRTLSCVAALGHIEAAALRIAEADRTPIEPIDIADAVPVDAGTMMSLLRGTYDAPYDARTRTASKMPEAEVEEAAEEASDAVEETAEAAVEEASEAVEEAAEEAADAVVEEAPETVEEAAEEAVEAVEEVAEEAVEEVADAVEEAAEEAVEAVEEAADETVEEVADAVEEAAEEAVEEAADAVEEAAEEAVEEAADDSTVDAAALTDGVYTVDTETDFSIIHVEATVEGGVITGAKITSEDKEGSVDLLSDDARAQFEQQIVDTQGQGVDAISGVTIASEAIQKAVADILAQAGN